MADGNEGRWDCDPTHHNSYHLNMDKFRYAKQKMLFLETIITYSYRSWMNS